jgi:hypothetical protein
MTLLKARVRPESFGGLIFSIDPICILMVNPTGYRIAQLLTQAIAPSDIVTMLADRFHVEPSMVQKDVEAFLAVLDRQGLLTIPFSHRRPSR